jgi:transposase-like protein
MEQASRASRRLHDKELKRQVLAECTEPGASVAWVAMAHGLNANLVHKRRRLAARQSGGSQTHGHRGHRGPGLQALGNHVAFELQRIGAPRPCGLFWRCSAFMLSVLAENFHAFRRASSKVAFSSLVSLNLMSRAWRSMCRLCSCNCASICSASSARTLGARALRFCAWRSRMSSMRQLCGPRRRRALGFLLLIFARVLAESYTLAITLSASIRSHGRPTTSAWNCSVVSVSPWPGSGACRGQTKDPW